MYVLFTSLRPFLSFSGHGFPVIKVSDFPFFLPHVLINSN